METTQQQYEHEYLVELIDNALRSRGRAAAGELQHGQRSAAVAPDLWQRFERLQRAALSSGDLGDEERDELRALRADLESARKALRAQ